ncbi:MAG: chorismate mutase, partial [Tetragenococcus halophilus]|nr:chorismate mutase [Tetragenococcus halophilus]
TTNIAQIKTNNNEDFFDTKRYEEILAQVRKAVTNTVYEEAIIETFKDGSIIYDVGEKSLASFFVSENRKQVSSPVE